MPSLDYSEIMADPRYSWMAARSPQEIAAEVLRRGVRGSNMQGALSPQASEALQGAVLPHSLGDVAMMASAPTPWGAPIAALNMTGMLDPTEAQAAPRGPIKAATKGMLEAARQAGPMIGETVGQLARGKVQGLDPEMLAALKTQRAMGVKKPGQELLNILAGDLRARDTAEMLKMHSPKELLAMRQAEDAQREAEFFTAMRAKLPPAFLRAQEQSGITQGVRAEYPKIYMNARELVQNAEAKVAPEHPALKELFGVNRGDLYDISQAGTRKGNITDPASLLQGWKANPSGSYAAEAIMNQRNAQRQIDVLGEALKNAPKLTQGMVPWYVMDPYYQHLEKLVGPEQARAMYREHNTVVPMFSAGSPVDLEINRGTTAQMMMNKGNIEDFFRYAGKEGSGGILRPSELMDVKGHPYQSTSHEEPLRKYLETGDPRMMSPKVPLYSMSSGVPQIGFQTRFPVADAHIARSSGIADVRRGAGYADSMLMPEYQQWGPWYERNVANKVGLEGVPGQALQWGAFSPATDVETMIGAPKLEIYAKNIWDRANRLGVDPKWLRDMVMTHREHAMWAPAAVVGGAGAASQFPSSGILSAEPPPQDRL